MLENLQELKKDMVSKKWTISSFLFTYKRIDYIVLVKLFVKNESKKKICIAKIAFYGIKKFK